MDGATIIDLFIGASRVCPPAASVFTPDELDARLRAIAEDIRARDPGIEDKSMICMACGRLGVAARNLENRGWVVRDLSPLIGVEINEVYCGRCFARWGWPPIEQRHSNDTRIIICS